MDDGAQSPGIGGVKHGIPVIGRAMEVLAFLERKDEGASVQELNRALGVPRSTVYRILNSLTAYGVIRRKINGNYVLGSWLVSLAAKVQIEAAHQELIRVADLHLRKLARETGESTKLSVPSDGHAQVMASIQGSGEYSLSPKKGGRFPLHLGAAGKLMLAYMPQDYTERLLSGSLRAYTDKTITDPAALKLKLEEIRSRGWAYDDGEHRTGVHAIAAPIFAADGSIMAAVSVPYIGGRDPSSQTSLREAIIAAAKAITAELARDRG